MPPLQFIGAQDILVKDVAQLIKTDEYLGTWPIYPTEAMINLDPDDTDIIPHTPPPFTTIQLGDKIEPSGQASMGGGRVTFSVQGRVVTFISTESELDIPSLYELGERFDYIFRKSDLEDSFANYIKGYYFKKSVPRPYMIVAEGYRKKAAETVTTEFVLKYEAIL